MSSEFRHFSRRQMLSYAAFASAATAAATAAGQKGLVCLAACALAPVPRRR